MTLAPLQEAVERFHDVFDHPHEFMFMGGGAMRCATRWLMVVVALRRPNGITLCMRCSEERGSPPMSHTLSLA